MGFAAAWGFVYNIYNLELKPLCLCKGQGKGTDALSSAYVVIMYNKVLSICRPLDSLSLLLVVAAAAWRWHVYTICNTLQHMQAHTWIVHPGNLEQTFCGYLLLFALRCTPWLSGACGALKELRSLHAEHNVNRALVIVPSSLSVGGELKS